MLNQQQYLYLPDPRSNSGILKITNSLPGTLPARLPLRHAKEIKHIEFPNTFRSFYVYNPDINIGHLDAGADLRSAQSGLYSVEYLEYLISSARHLKSFE